MTSTDHVRGGPKRRTHSVWRVILFQGKAEALSSHEKNKSTGLGNDRVTLNVDPASIEVLADARSSIQRKTGIEMFVDKDAFKVTRQCPQIGGKTIDRASNATASGRLEIECAHSDTSLYRALHKQRRATLTVLQK